MSVLVYGISNCDTVKKARAWLTAQGVDYQFHDFKKQGLPVEQLDVWCAVLGWEKLLNRKGTMWRKQAPEVQAAVVDVHSAKLLMLAQSSVIKRPVVMWKNAAPPLVTVGFDVLTWSGILGRPIPRAGQTNR